MKPTKLYLTLFIVASCMTFTLSAQAAWLWSPETGQWTNSKSVPKDTPEHQFLVSKEYYDKGDHSRALQELEKLISSFPHTRWAAEAQFHIGLVHEEKGDVGKAAEAFRVLVDRYPYSDRLNDAVEHEYFLAESMLSGKKTKFLGMEVLPSVDVAAELFKHIVKAAPYGEYGDKAQYQLAEAEFQLGNYEEAERALQAVIDDYPTSELAAQAKYRIAQMSYETAFKHASHVEQTDEAIRRYEGFKQSFPDSQMKFEADEAILELRQKKAQSIYDTAKFYHARKKYKSAQIYYEDVVRKFPDTTASEHAIAGLKAIEGLTEDPKTRTPKLMGLFPVGDWTKDKDEVIEDKPGAFLGIFPGGKRDDELKSTKQEPDKFLGIFPMNKKEEKVTVQTHAEKPKKFLGLF